VNCDFGDWSCGIGSLFGAWADTAAGQALEAIGAAITDGLVQSVQSLASMWVTLPTPNIIAKETERIPSSAEEGMTTLLSWALWIGLVMCVLALIGYGATLGFRSGRYGRTLARLGYIFLAVTLIGGSSALIASILSVGSGGVASAVVGDIQDSLLGVVGTLAVISLIIGAVRIAWEQRATGARKALASIVTLLIVAGGSLPIIALLVRIADHIAEEIMTSAGEGLEISDNFELLVGAGNLATGGGGLLVFIVVGLLALLGTVVQIGLLVLRGAMLVLLAGILPLAASATGTETGRAWFMKVLGWLLAFIAYKPAAAIIYATAFRLLRDDQAIADPTGIWANIAGLAMMMLAVLALPAMMKFVIPVVATQAGGSSGGAALLAISQSLPSGARAANSAHRTDPQPQSARSPEPQAVGATSAPGSARGASGLAMTAKAPVAAAAAGAAKAAGTSLKKSQRVELDLGKPEPTGSE
jgi:type IV secretion system protein TrbL